MKLSKKSFAAGQLFVWTSFGMVPIAILGEKRASA